MEEVKDIYYCKECDRWYGSRENIVFCSTCNKAVCPKCCKCWNCRHTHDSPLGVKEWPYYTG